MQKALKIAKSGHTAYDLKDCQKILKCRNLFNTYFFIFKPRN